MPAQFTIDATERIVVSHGWGVLTDADLIATQQGVRSDPRFDPSFRQLYDFSEVTEVALTAGCVQKLSATSPFAREAARAVVVGSDLAFGMARMYALLGNRDPQRFRIFRSRADAVAWLQSLT